MKRETQAQATNSERIPGDSPRNENQTSGGSMATKKAPVTKARKARRTSYELLQDLEARRQSLTDSYNSKFSKLESRINNLRERHAQRIEVSEITAKFSPEEIDQQMSELKARLAAFRRANRVKPASA